jgi:hypothetical protein
MWEGFIGKQVRRCNRNLLITNVVLLAACAAIGALNFNYLSNWFRGTAPIDPQQIAQLRAADDLKRNFVSFDVPEIFESGVTEVETKDGKETGTTLSDFIIVPVGNKVLVVKTLPSQASSKHIEGQLIAMPADVDSEMRRGLTEEQNAAVLPFMLDAKDYRDDGWWLLGIGVPIILLCVWNLTKWMQRSSDPAASPIVKRLGGQQGVLTIGQQLDIEMIGGTEKFGAAVVSPSFLHAPYLYDSKIIPLEDLVWVHKKVTQRRVNFVPAGKTYEASLYMRNGQACSITGNETQVNGLLEKLANRYPWIIAGWTAELEATWKKNAAAVIAAVDERRAKAKGAGAGS